MLYLIIMKIELKQGQKLWFTSDTHYNHSNICRATTRWTDADSVTRDFSSLEKMNEELVYWINHNVAQDDILIHLGDWSFGGFEFIKQFRGSDLVDIARRHIESCRDFSLKNYIPRIKLLTN